MTTFPDRPSAAPAAPPVRVELTPISSASVSPLAPPEQLRTRLAAELRDRIRSGEWAPGDKLPTEAELIERYGVSRSTVRAAIQQLESQGLTVTRHGVGTFVTRFGTSISAGLQELRSMSDTIRAHGMTPRMDYHQAEIRPASDAEADALDRPVGFQVLATARAVYADETLVAFSYEHIPLDLLPDGIDPASVHGSLFTLLEDRGVYPKTAVAQIHAIQGPEIGWGERPKNANYLLLDQMHYDADGVALLTSKTYFIEGRFQFSILRVRS